MVKIWYRDSDETNRSGLHQPDPVQFLTADELFKKTGVKYVQISDDVLDNEEELLRLRKKYDIASYDILEVIPTDSPEHLAKMKKFYTEHLHEDPEIRLFTGGGGYFEMRDMEDKWIRVHLGRGDLIDLPPGIFHRFTIDDQNYVKMLRFFKELPKWEAVNRCDAGANSSRVRYAEFMKKITA